MNMKIIILMTSKIKSTTSFIWLHSLWVTRELTDFLPWQWARDARLTGQKVRSNDWFAPQSGAGLSGGLTQSGNSRVRTAKRCERQG